MKQITPEQMGALVFILTLYWYCPKCHYKNHPLHTHCHNCGHCKFKEFEKDE